MLILGRVERTEDGQKNKWHAVDESRTLRVEKEFPCGSTEDVEGDYAEVDEVFGRLVIRNKGEIKFVAQQKGWLAVRVLSPSKQNQ